MVGAGVDHQFTPAFAPRISEGLFMTNHRVWRLIVCLIVCHIVPVLASAQPIAGRWRLVAAEDIRADGSVARYPWGRRPVGSIVVEGGACYLQIMSSDVPAFTPETAPVGEQMKAALLGTYIAYSGPCTIDDAESSVTISVEAAWRPGYVGTQQKRFFRFEHDRLLFGPAPGSTRMGDEALTRRLTLERAAPADRLPPPAGWRR